MKAHLTISPRQEAQAERNLCAALASLHTAEECRAFLRDLCTPAELQAMADRWAVVDHLKRGVPYREVHRLTGVSVTTIGRVARFLAGGNGGYATAAQRLKEARRTTTGGGQPDGPRHG
ncbi:MAG TPA: YerC/YecD family TrpR-related protein [Steroidobacteraceae bacterium]|nr:YerC/YecD family TrpR-related protein [Steroidobacteraceae bacterium]